MAPGAATAPVSTSGAIRTGRLAGLLGAPQIALPISAPITLAGNAVSVVGDTAVTDPGTTDPGTPGTTDPGTPGTDEPGATTTDGETPSATVIGAATAVGNASAAVTGELAETGGSFPYTALLVGAVLIVLGMVPMLRRRAA
jgi:hypothetical protein